MEGIDEAGWRAMSYIADATNDGVLRGLVAWAITQAETARQQLAGSEERLRARIAAIDAELRQRFVQALSGGG